MTQYTPLAGQDWAGSKAALDHLNETVLEPGETLVWQGRPDPGKAMRVETINLVKGLFFILVGGFVVGGAYAESVSVAAIGGAVMAWGAWSATLALKARKSGAKSFYAITDRRVIILSEAEWGYKITSLRSADIWEITVKRRAGNTGDIGLRSHEVVDLASRGNANLSDLMRGKGQLMDTYRKVDFEDGLWGIQELDTALAAIEDLQSRGKSNDGTS